MAIASSPESKTIGKDLNLFGLDLLVSVLVLASMLPHPMHFNLPFLGSIASGFGCKSKENSSENVKQAKLLIS